MDADHKHDQDITICNKCKSEINKKPRKKSTLTYDCKKCNEIFDSKALIKKHYKTCYPGLTCPICETLFDVCTNLITIKLHADDCLTNHPGGYHGNKYNFFESLNNFFDGDD